MGGAPALPLAGAGLDETALVWDGEAGLTGRTLGASSLPVEAAGWRSTPELSDGAFHFTVCLTFRIIIPLDPTVV